MQLLHHLVVEPFKFSHQELSSFSNQSTIVIFAADFDGLLSEHCSDYSFLFTERLLALSSLRVLKIVVNLRPSQSAKSSNKSASSRLFFSSRYATVHIPALSVLLEVLKKHFLYCLWLDS